MRNVEEIIARNIIMRLDELSIDQSDLAKSSKLSRQTISRIINRQQKSIRAGTRDAIATALNMSRAELEKDPSAHYSAPEKNDLELDNRALRNQIKNLEDIISNIPSDIINKLKVADKDDIDAIRGILGPSARKRANKKDTKKGQ